VAVVAVETATHGTSTVVYQELAARQDLRVAAEIQEDDRMRLWVVAKADAEVDAIPRPTKTSLALGFPATKGSSTVKRLQSILHCLTVHNAEVTKFESPQPTVCYVDIIGGETDADVSGVIKALRSSCQSVRVLGSFPFDSRGKSSVDGVLSAIFADACPNKPCESNNSGDSDSANENSVNTEKKSSGSTEGEPQSMSERFPLNPMIANVQLGKNMILHGLAKHMEAKGREVYTLSFGEPDFLPPDRVIQAGIHALEQGKVRYSDMRGDPKLRALITKYLALAKNVQYDPATEILISSGGQQGLFYVFYSVLRPGDKVILPSPYWAVHAAVVHQMQGNLLLLPGKIEEEYLISPRELEKMLTANPDTKMLLLCNPSNPVGTLHSPERLEEIAAVLRKPQFRHVIVLSDEIYEQLIYQDEGEATRVHQSFASLPGMRDRTITVNGFSKAYAMTGMRVGYVAAPAHFVSPLLLCQSIFSSTVNTIGQMAAIEAMTLELECIEQGRSRIVDELQGLDENRKYIVDRLNAIPKVRFAYPTSAFYVFVDLSAFFRDKRAYVVASDGNNDDEGDGSMEEVRDVADMCMFLLRRHAVAVSPGIDFGDPFGLRISYAGARATLERAMDGIERCLSTSLRFVDL
jgi:aspartate/glutamate/aspartate-prephenate aminotransferase